MGEMAYIATNPETGECYAICSADPKFIASSVGEIAGWKRAGAKIELLPQQEALDRFMPDDPAEAGRKEG